MDRWLGPRTKSPDINLLDFFLWDSMMLIVYHGGKPEARRQLLEATDKATIGIRNELGCMQSDGGHFRHVL